ncbi:MAG: bifunctional farnesyl-diphosphate farnesyltransferase/squalene synthase [Sclerophora amabilis]|nr:MAG: bifunctional farnesyl-diphosphate farnesyltransferase/squalene synthase [Sclerophora amabilis]
MAMINNVFYYIFHMSEFRSIVQWKVWHEPVHERDVKNEPISVTTCFEFLDQTSRSFSGVIQELHSELLLPVALFYLILRGLDTIEDDMTIDLAEKDRLLRDFSDVLDQKGWSYDGNGPDEKDRNLLVKFFVVIDEFSKVKPAYQTIIKDITKKMGNGMADYVQKAAKDIDSVRTVRDYGLYCHYVAGLVGEGLTRLFVEGKLANPALLDRPHLHESMGQMLQKTNIIRDVHEDWVEHRRFWPKEIWSKHVDNFDDLFDPRYREQALNCGSDMVLNALNHADECLFYLAGIKDQSCFNFTAIPQSMAIATLELVFRNPKLFEKNVKITKGLACQLMVESSQNLRVVCGSFRRHIRKIHAKNTPSDPNFMSINIACGKVEQFIESIFPSQTPKMVALEQTGESADPEQDAIEAEAKRDMMYLMGAVLLTLLVLSAIMISIAWYFGAKFDLNQSPSTRRGLKSDSSATGGLAHGEL